MNRIPVPEGQADRLGPLDLVQVAERPLNLCELVGFTAEAVEMEPQRPCDVVAIPTVFGNRVI